MVEPNVLLGVDPGANIEQMREAYNRRRAELLAREGSPEADESLRELDEAYARMMERYKPALQTAPATPREPRNSILDMVNNLDVPIQDYTGEVVLKPCPYCSGTNPEQASICATCGRQIARPCPNCGKVVELTQNACPRCGVIIREHDQARMAEAMVVNQRIQGERSSSQLYVDTLEAGHSERLKLGIVFWLAVLLIGAGICAVTAYLLLPGFQR
jgi:hypothetical protein